jgi:hypothetical protein
MTKLSSVLVPAAVLFLAQAAVAADRYVGAPPPGAYPPAPIYPYLLPPCRDSFWDVLLQCMPRTVVVPSDDLYTQNALRGLRPTTRKPYIQVFTW